MTDAQAGTPMCENGYCAIAEARGPHCRCEKVCAYAEPVKASDTPLTDAQAKFDWGELVDEAPEYVSADFARSLELTVAELRKEVAEANDLFDKLRQQHEWLRKDAEQASARCAQLERGEFICKKCGLRKDAEHEPADF